MSPADVEADICMIGAGAAGCFLAHAISRSGLRTIIVEAGGRTTASAAEIGLESAFAHAVYSGATEGRFFGLGGTTAHWGGLLAPHGDRDLGGGDTQGAAWQHIVDTVGAESRQVLETLGYRGGDDFAERAGAIGDDMVQTLREAGIATLAALHLPFRRKNLRGLLDTAMKAPTAPHLVTDATVIGWEHVDVKSCTIKGIRVRASDGSEAVIRARRFVVAAGALESARLLLELRDGQAGALIPATALIGQGLSDHLSLPIADVAERDRALAARMFGPRFDGAWMRTFRLMAGGTPRSFAHFTFAMEGAGFQLARKALQALQRRSWPAIGTGEASRAAADLTRIAWARFARQRLHLPPGAPVHLQLDIEQAPTATNQLGFGERRDILGRRIPIIDWRISDDDLAQAERTAARYLQCWQAAGPSLPVLLPRLLSTATAKPHDAYHPAGLTRLGADPAAVVDFGLKVHGLDNLFLVSTGVLPSPGTANPTFTMLCLANRLARTLADAKDAPMGDDDQAAKGES
ncbi:GMC oxidoreductase [Rhizorhabdus sp.]|uniref:GMC oxidoreductase n=1 Tax=Rhizorhabdus sp. TaxID=1968843 RepID=UPI0019BF646F|nr:GMC oxidoreductase [Rhizorhabdus sp.]MBD3760745.1 GMC family oxidoreductase [Rhizorhabdus sp.]